MSFFSDVRLSDSMKKLTGKSDLFARLKEALLIALTVVPRLIYECSRALAVTR